jgi:hypothetical protein
MMYDCTNEAITELQEIHLQITGEFLSEAEAQAMARELFRLFLAVYEPIPKRWLEELPDFKNHHPHNH